ncbi:hypothetical protein J2X68_000748 [Streptomyces sp. 3330]|uniref:hypothetical protein n=1 Tax=Streptomyces sp. 3330 TaxID=2817755 RepID=UPI00285E29F6|nr:hypothetical protein [Streptomyces sp. 3330]MDR6974070.1 hypothetical protein [Streptomyces sp. 3330]
MSTRRTFEDRLLDELRTEIELGEAGALRAGPATAVEPGGGRTRASARRLFTPPRIAVVAVACAAAWFGAAALPGSSATSTAYAVERHGDGTVTLTVKDRTIDVTAQRELATRVRPWGIEVTIDVLAPGYVCERSRPTSPSVRAVDRHGDRIPVVPLEAGWDVTLRRGNVLAFENTEGMSRPRAVELYSTRSQAEPCLPLKVTLPTR